MNGGDLLRSKPERSNGIKNHRATRIGKTGLAEFVAEFVPVLCGDLLRSHLPSSLLFFKNLEYMNFASVASTIRPHVCLSVCLIVCLFVCLSVCLFVCLSACLYVCLSICRPSVCPSVRLVFRRISARPVVRP